MNTGDTGSGQPMQKIILIALALLLVVNLLVWNNMRQLGTRLDQFQGQLNSVQSSMTHEIGSMRGELQAAREQEQWWTPGDVQIGEVDGNRARVEVSWYLKEYREGSEVALNYSPPGEAQFLEMPAERGSGGHFTAAVMVEVPLEPVFSNVVIQTFHSERNYRWPAVAEEKAIAQIHGAANLQYFISVKEGDTVKTGMVRHLDLSKLNYGLFNPLDAAVHIDADKGAFNLTVSERIGSEQPDYTIEKMVLEVRDRHGTVLESRAMEKQNLDRGSQIYVADIPLAVTHEGSVYCKVHYSDSLIVEKAIYSAK